MKSPKILVTVILPALLSQAPQTSSSVETSGGLQTAVFSTPQGIIRANFPDDIAAGDTISGTVIAQPAGTTEQEQHTNSATLSGYVIETEDKKISAPVHHRTGTWSIPETTVLTLILRGPDGTPVSRSMLKVGPRVDPIPPDIPPTPDDFEIPSTGGPGGTVSIAGPFRGNALQTSVSFAGKAAEVLAESPRKAIARVPPDIVGPVELRIEEGATIIVGQFRSLRVALSAPKLTLKSGETTKLTVTVSGLKDIREPRDMTLENLSTGVVQLAGGPVQHFQIKPGELSETGAYQTTRTLTGIVMGGFNITAFIRDEPLDRFNLRQAVFAALAKWQSNTGIRIAPGAQVSIARAVHATKPELRRLLLAQNSRSNLESLTASLVRDYCFNLRDYKAGYQAGKSVRPASPFIHSFQPPAPPAVSEITVDDTKSHTFIEYLSRLIASLSTIMEVGHVEIASTPAPAPIMIDDKPRGSTIRTFVISSGRHTIVIAMPGKPCRRNIQVLADQPVSVACP